MWSARTLYPSTHAYHDASVPAADMPAKYGPRPGPASVTARAKFTNRLKLVNGRQLPIARKKAHTAHIRAMPNVGPLFAKHHVRASMIRSARKFALDHTLASAIDSVSTF